ncbi:MAG: 1-deoxy-D-xylulose-5-phosphate reductoisomerase [Hyphomicrobiales bacterium]|jgi:1-deoxy-D-xylulose-5-phosphate reductoisomerase|nr:1-deoxy-D-xylulose-5-phosphate reductoisomerase [Hyphomicrobiales bacterium]
MRATSAISQFDAAQSARPRRLVILGATGSVGRTTRSVILNTPEKFDVEVVAGGQDVEALAQTAIALRAKRAVIADAAGYQALRTALAGTSIIVSAGAEAMCEAAALPSDMVIGAIAGTAGVRPTHAAVAAGRTVALANKECLVCAGGPFMRAVQRSGGQILPMDSEHNAIFQALGGAHPDTIERMILTASGGPFRTWTNEAIANATPEQALAHPNWLMGPKVTIDSAGLMNKGLELIEAHFLFGVGADRLDVLVHPQSIVHGLVSFADGAIIAGLAHPDMAVPIAHCLGYPNRLSTQARRLDLAEIGTLTFERPDYARFPALGVAMEALRHGEGLPTVLNAANEVAVDLFLQRRIGFQEIARIVAKICEQAVADGSAREAQSIDEALAVDHVSRERCRTLLA